MRILILFFLSIPLATGCASQKDLARKSVYNFTVGEDNFQITSINTESGEGTNFLSQIDEAGKTSFKARDLNQDGTIDIILKGSLSLPEANAIYNEGINSARAQGNYQEKNSLRTFEFEKNDTLYTIKSYLVDSDNSSNLFAIYKQLTGEEILLSDVDANGTLDSIEKGNITLEQANPLYTYILKEGIRSERIIFVKGRYIVQQQQPLQTAAVFHQ